jgi:transposase
MSSKELRRAGVLARVVSGELKLVNAAVMMGVSYRQSKRLGRRYREQGAEGLKHRSAGRESNRKKPKKFRERVMRLVGKKYSGEEGERFGPTLAAEHLASDDHVEVKVQTLRAGCCQKGCGVGRGSGGRIASGGNGKSIRVSWCRWMEAFMTGWRDEAQVVA